MKLRKILGFVLAFLLGNFGMHHSYLGNYRLSFTYAFFSVTGIPGILALGEAFVMPRRINNLEKENLSERSYLKFVLYPIAGFVTQIVLLFILLGSVYFFAPSTEDLSEIGDQQTEAHKLSSDRQEKLIEKLISNLLRFNKDKFTDEEIVKLDLFFKTMVTEKDLFFRQYTGRKFRSNVNKKEFLEILSKYPINAEYRYISFVEEYSTFKDLVHFEEVWHIAIGDNRAFEEKNKKIQIVIGIKPDSSKILLLGMKVGEKKLAWKEYHFSSSYKSK